MNKVNVIATALQDFLNSHLIGDNWLPLWKVTPLKNGKFEVSTYYQAWDSHFVLDGKGLVVFTLNKNFVSNPESFTIKLRNSNTKWRIQYFNKGKFLGEMARTLVEFNSNFKETTLNKKQGLVFEMEKLDAQIRKLQEKYWNLHIKMRVLTALE